MLSYFQANKEICLFLKSIFFTMMLRKSIGNGDIMVERTNFNKKLKKTRMQAGLSGKELANKADIPYTTYMAYENRDRQPSAENLAKIAAALGVTSEYLLQDSNIPASTTANKPQLVAQKSSDISPLLEELEKTVSFDAKANYQGNILDEKQRQKIFALISDIKSYSIFGVQKMNEILRANGSLDDFKEEKS